MQNAGGAAPSAHPDSAGSRLTPDTSGVTAEAEEVCLSWEPRLVPLLLTRYSCSGWLFDIQAHSPNGVADCLLCLGSSAARASCRRLGRRAMPCWKVCILQCS